MTARRAARIILVSADNKLVLMKRTRPGQLYYTLIGGGIEGDESPAQAAIREAFEETGIIIDEPRFLFDATYSVGDREIMDIFFIAREIRRETAMGVEWVERNCPDNQYELVELTRDELADINLVPSEFKDKFIGIFTDYIKASND